MRKVWMSIFIVILLMSCCFIISPSIDSKQDTPPTRSATIIVDQSGSGNFTKIQDAINASSDGDTIYVWDGIYNEKLYVDSSVKIIGNSTETTIIYRRYTTIVDIRSPNVEISNISVQGGNRGITINSDRSNIQNLNLSNCGIGIYINANYANITNCRFLNNIISIFYGHLKQYGLIEGCHFESQVSITATIDLLGWRGTISNNTFINVTINIDLNGFINTYTMSNNVYNGLPVIFEKGVNNITFQGKNAQMFLIDSSDLIIKDLEYAGIPAAISLYNCENIEFDGLSFDDISMYGIGCKLSRNIFINSTTFNNTKNCIQSIDCTGSFGLKNSNFTNCEKGADLRESQTFQANICYNRFSNVSNPVSIVGSNINISHNQCIDCGWIAQIIDSWNITVDNNFCTNEMITYTSGYGISMMNSQKCSITNNNISRKDDGFYCSTTTDLIIENNLITSTSDGVIIGSSAKVLNNVFYKNTRAIQMFRGSDSEIRNNLINHSIKTGIGITLLESTDYVIFNNTIKENVIGIKNDESNNGLISHNYFIDNDVHVESTGTDKWYSNYPSHGNYWSDYIGSDIKKGKNQDQHGSDGIGDTPYTVIGTQSDRYPIFIDTLDPFAKCGEDVVILPGTLYHFSAEDSTDDQLVVRALWEFEYNGSKRTIDHLEFDFLFEISGIYTVNMTVFDFAGNSDTDSMNITVEDTIRPVAVSQGNISIDMGEIAYFDGTLSTDNDMIVNYSWSIIQYSGCYPPIVDGKVVPTRELHGYARLYGPTPSLPFSEPFIGICSLSVRDHAGNFDQDSFYLVVNDIIDPIADAGDDIVINNSQVAEFDGTGCTDNLGIYFNKVYNWTLEYDGEIIILEGERPTFVFDIPGYYNVTMTVFDHWGNSDTDHVMVTVVDTIQPVARISGSLNVFNDGQISLSGLGSTDNHRIAKYLWTFNDSEPMEIEGPFLNYSFKTRGFIKITLTVFDQWYNSHSVKVIVEVYDTTPPIAVAGEDRTINAGDTIALNASGSNDNGTIVKWEWTFIYGGEDKILTGEVVNFTFEISGEYSILLSVHDDSRNIDKDQIIIIVTSSIDDDDDDDVVGDDDTDGKDNEFPIVVVIIIGIVVLLFIIGLIIFILMRKKEPEEEQIAQKEKDDLENLLDTLPPEELYPSEQDSIMPPEPEPIQEEGDVFGDYNLPEENADPIAETPIEENIFDPSQDIVPEGMGEEIVDEELTPPNLDSAQNVIQNETLHADQ